MSDYDATDIVNFAIDGNMIGIQTAVDSILKDRVAEILDNKKIEVAKKFFNTED
jgi:hypothetical protein